MPLTEIDRVSAVVIRAGARVLRLSQHRLRNMSAGELARLIERQLERELDAQRRANLRVDAVLGLRDLVRERRSSHE